MARRLSISMNLDQFCETLGSYRDLTPKFVRFGV